MGKAEQGQSAIHSTLLRLTVGVCGAMNAGLIGGHRDRAAGQFSRRRRSPMAERMRAAESPCGTSSRQRS